MEIAFGIVCVLLFLMVAVGPLLMRWFRPLLQRWAMGKMEDQMRRMAGMPTRREEKKARRRAGRDRKAAERFRSAAAGARAYGASRRRRRSTVGLLRYVAEDVEFTEIKEYSSDPVAPERKAPAYREEEQIEDAEYTEIKGN